MRTYLKALLWALPIWLLLIGVLIPGIPDRISQILSWLYLPGMSLVFLIQYLIALVFPSSTWSIHNTYEYIFTIVNCALYYGLLYLIFFLMNTKVWTVFHPAASS